MFIIYHNPKCSKSRNAVQYLSDHNHDFKIIEYLKYPPTAIELKKIIKKLNTNIHDIIRKKEPEYKIHHLHNNNLSEDQIIDILINTPKLIERPIIISNNSACIARPLDNLINMINDESK